MEDDDMRLKAIGEVAMLFRGKQIGTGSVFAAEAASGTEPWTRDFELSLEPGFFELFMGARLKQLTTNILPPVST